jgi:hypothetical protein
MAKLGKTNAGAVPESVPHLKSRGLKNPKPADYELGGGHPDMSKGNDGSGGKAGSAPASGKKDPTE